MFHWQFLITCIFSESLKLGAYYNTGPRGQKQSEECYFMFTCTFVAFFCCFLLKKCIFINFFSFFAGVSNFHNRILPNQKPELVIRDCQRNYILLRRYYSKHFIEGAGIFWRALDQQTGLVDIFHLCPRRFFEGAFDWNFMIYILWYACNDMYTIQLIHSPVTKYLIESI